jgi:HlyD family secretion protein
MRTAVAALVVALAAACRREAAEAPAPTARVERGRIERIVVATGTIEPEKEVEVRPRISGIVERLHVDAGDVVVLDQPLVEIERELLEAQAEEARGRLQDSRVEARFAETDYQRAASLRREGTASAQEYDRARTRLERAQAAISRDEGTLHALEVQLRYATVRAPMAGTILDVDVKVGSAVASVVSVTGGTRLLTMAAAERLHLKGLVDENEIAYVHVGQPARIRTEAHGSRVFPGTVREIKPLGQRQQNVTYFEVEVEVMGEDTALLRPRMSADGDIVTEVVEDALLVPETALRFEGEGVHVERVRAGEAAGERRPVQIGIVNGSRVQVMDGLALGDEVRLR